MALLDYQSFYLVGIKGVALAALAQCLLDAGKKVTGSDVAEDFVTKQVLESRRIEINVGFDTNSITSTQSEVVIYTAAHQGPQNPQVLAAVAKGLPVFSHAQALAELFDQKQGLAVCGVGGKSTTSAMIAWVLELIGHHPSFAVGVGGIAGLDNTGSWSQTSNFFVAEADEYVTDPSAPARGEKITPRFSYLHPLVTVCTNLQFDHPDVYRDFEHTKSVFATFFQQIKAGGSLIINADDQPLVTLAENIKETLAEVKVLSFGRSELANCRLLEYRSAEGTIAAKFRLLELDYQLTLHIPGEFNVFNALAAITAVSTLGVEPQAAANALASFKSTMRRTEYIGQKQGVTYYDDYAHHPHEIEKVIASFREWYPRAKLVIAFQAHTFSRTKALFKEFVTSFKGADEVLMIDIFASAREAADESISSATLCEAIADQFPLIKAQNLGTLDELTQYCQTQLKAGDVCVTVGAGNIYELHERLS